MGMMEDKDFLKMERAIEAALSGENNEFSRPIDELSNHMRAMSPSPVLKEFPEFNILWERSQNEAQGSRQNPGNKENNHRDRKLYAAAIMLFALGLGGAMGVWKNSDQLALFMNYLPFGDKKISTTSPVLQAKILNLHGEAFLLNSDKSFRNSLGNIQYLESGERFYVENGGFLDLQISNSIALRVLGGSEVLLQSGSDTLHGEKTILYLIQGKVLSKVIRLKKNSEFSIRTEGGDVLVRGTRFATEWNQSELRIAVSDGKVAFRRPYDKVLDESRDILVLPGFEIAYKQGETTQVPLSSDFKKSLAELDYLSPEMSEDYRFIQSEDDLYRLYSILEQVEMEGGRKLRGVVYDMDESHLYIRTLDGEKKIPQSKILNVEKIR